MNIKNKGFTLIELLVVIAIIGILAAIVLVSLSGARNSAKDARITADMQQMRNLAETYNSSEGNYDDLLAESDATTLVNDVVAQGGNYNYATSATAYCVTSQLNSKSFWCVDSNLKSNKYTASVCAAANVKCE